MCACVMTIAVTRRAWRCRMARMASMSSPGSTTMASRVASSPKTEQLHCSIPTGRISWIIRPIVYSGHAGHSHDHHALGAYFLSRDACRQSVVCAAGGDACAERLAGGRAPGGGKPLRSGVSSGGDGGDYRADCFGPLPAADCARAHGVLPHVVRHQDAPGIACVRGGGADRAAEQSAARAHADGHLDFGVRDYLHLGVAEPHLLSEYDDDSGL